jgi:signal peptidase I
MKARPLPILSLLLLAGLAYRLCLLPILISGDSMEPSLHSGSLRLMKRLLISSAPLTRYEVVVARVGGELIIKRVIAFPGEWVGMSNGVFFVDGRPLSEPIPLKRGTWTIKTGLVESNNFLLIGDNRDWPAQSFFMVQKEAIVARSF